MHPPTAPPRAVLYLRQSVSREESISLELQETAGRAHAEQHGYEVVAVESDPGISGRTWNRPAVQRVMTMIEGGEADVIVLWKWSRLSRSRLDWAVAADKVETAGGRIESATEPIDVTTSTGRLARGMLTEFAAFESERISDTWKETHARRIAKGLPTNGRPRFGYNYNRDKGFTPDPITGPILADLYRRYISGESFRSLILWLNANGIQATPGYAPAKDTWVISTLQRILDRGFGAGNIYHRGKLVPGVQEPIITPAEWTEYQTRREARRQQRSGENTQYLLTGLMYCQQCGGRMYGHAPKDDRITIYRCLKSQRSGPHPGSTVSASRAETTVFEWLQTIAADIDRATPASPSAPSLAPSNQLPVLRRNLLKVAARLDTLTNKFIDDTIPQDAYERIRDGLIGERDSIEVRIRELELAVVKPAVSLVPDLVSNWDVFPFQVKRDLLGRVVGRIEISLAEPLNLIVVRGRWTL